VRTKNGFVRGIKLLSVLGDVGTSVLETKKREKSISTICIKFLVIAMKLMLDSLEKHLVMRLPASLMSVKLVQREKHERKIPTKNGKEEIQSVKRVCTLTLAQSSDLLLVDLNFGH
jgi:hypothetical protein